MTKFKNWQPGFTLIELMVVVSIIVLFSVAFLPNISQYRNLENLQDGSTQLQSDIRKAQNNAVSGVKCFSDGTFTPHWSLILLGNNSYRVDGVCPSAAHGTFLNVDTVIDQVTFTTNGTPCPINSNVTGSNLNGLGMQFNNISGTVTFLSTLACTVNDKTTQMAIRMHINSNTSRTVTITVDRGGSVNILQ
jgi:prepilin-type N-terminal cleavage/methylation domain-containing protein